MPSGARVVRALPVLAHLGHGLPLMYGSKGMCVVMNNRGFARLATYPAA